MDKLKAWKFKIAPVQLLADNLVKENYANFQSPPIGNNYDTREISATKFSAYVDSQSTGKPFQSLYSQNKSGNISNTTEDTYKDPSDYTLHSIIIISIIVILIILLIVIGNLLVIVAIAVDRNLKRIQNWFIASLALSDLLVGLLVMPFSLANELMGYWYFGDILCELWLAVDVLLCTASILNLCLISLDRYWSITRAITYVRNRTKTRAVIMITMVWALSIMICVPPLVYPGWNRPKGYIFGLPFCVVNESLGYVIYSTMGSFYIPGIIMVVVYIKIYLAARYRARRGLKKGKPSTDTKSTTTTFTSVGLAQHAKVGTDSDDLYSDEIPPATAHKCDNSHKCSENHAQVIENSQFKTKEDEAKDCKHKTHQKKDDKNMTKIKNSSSNDSNFSDNDCMEKSTPLLPKETKKSCYEGESCALVGDNGANLATPQRDYRTNGVAPANSKATADSINTSRPLCVLETKGKALCQASVTEPSSIREAEKHKRRVAKAKERRATIVLGIIMATFIMCWLPFFSIYLISSIFSFYVDKMVFAIFFWAGYCNSALNPLIYTIFNREFRQAFHRIVFGRKDYRR